ncbi:MAG: hypothetical protein GX625_01065 [Clostridiaceae bacterium]|nr:hypothetical protein [Clostridiaceae bacterium]
MGVEGVSSARSANNSADTARAKNELSAEDFLQILAAELQYQDPTKGADTTQYISQLAQLTVVEQLEALNNSFSQMQFKQDILIGSSWIGKEVAIYEESGYISTGIVKGFVLTDKGVEVFVNNKQYSLDNIAAVKEQTQTDSEPGTGSAE